MAARLTLGGVRRDLVRAAFCDFFGVGEARSDLLIALYELQGQPAPWGELRYGADSHRPPNRGAVQESIRLLRVCMNSEAIDTSEAGYFLTEVGLAECRNALVSVAKALTAEASAARPAETLRTRRIMGVR